MYISFLLHAVCSAHLTPVDLFTIITVCEENVFSLCSFLHSSLIFSIIDPNMMLSALFPHMSSVVSFLWVGYQVTRILIALTISLCRYQHQWKRSNDVAQVLCFILNFAQNRF
jgi:hypothetical protein